VGYGEEKIFYVRVTVNPWAKTGVALALLGDDGPTGGFFHLGKPLPW
jgi:hypothetical protein